MGGVFAACTQTGGHLNTTAIGANGIVKGAYQDIDDAALEAISNGIGIDNKASLRQTV